MNSRLWVQEGSRETPRRFGVPAQWIAPAAIGVLAAAGICVIALLPANRFVLLIAALACLGLIPIITYFDRVLEDLALFALALTLSVSLKFHPVFRSDHIGGSI